MRLKGIRVQNFRNVGFAELNFAGRLGFLVGENGQGKTNLLEAAGFLGGLRSFRQAEARVLIREGEGEAKLWGAFEQELLGRSEVSVELRRTGKEVWCDGERVARMGDFLGKFPSVVMSSQDLALVRGAPSGRRRWLDLALASSDGIYLRAAQNYHRALAERNALLKGRVEVPELGAFERLLAENAEVLTEKRREGVEALDGVVREVFGRLMGEGFAAGMRLAADAGAKGAEEWMAIFEKGRARDLQMGTTLRGPHHDELVLTVEGRLAKDFGSEGQQRGLSVALRLAELEFLRRRTGVEPLLLVDDVLGELDEGRRGRFWEVVGAERQVLATGTVVPPAGGEEWEVWEVRGGEFGRR